LQGTGKKGPSEIAKGIQPKQKLLQKSHFLSIIMRGGPAVIFLLDSITIKVNNFKMLELIKFCLVRGIFGTEYAIS
jgi:hypothetical protein